MMKVVFVSNYFNHHQSAFCRKMDLLTEHGFTFLETEPMDEERLQLGWQQTDTPAYVLCWDEDPEASAKMVMEADALIIGGSDDNYVKPRLNAGKLTFRMEETIFKDGWGKLLNPHTWNMLWKCHYIYRNKPVYMLCASANLPAELRKLHLYKDRMFRWGYFPETKEYNFDALLAEKSYHPMEIVWCARFIDWKHPEEMVELAKMCRKQNIPAHITMIGDGVMFEEVKAQIATESLGDMITLTGALHASSVRSFMEKASVFVATSGREEGWGAVLNEAMNSGCICFAKNQMGATGFLIDNGINGWVYDNIREMPDKLQHLCEENRKDIREAAYTCILEKWNGEKAAERFFSLIEDILNKGNLKAFLDGPCSRVV